MSINIYIREVRGRPGRTNSPNCGWLQNADADCTRIRPPAPAIPARAPAPIRGREAARCRTRAGRRSCARSRRRRRRTGRARRRMVAAMDAPRAREAARSSSETLQGLVQRRPAAPVQAVLGLVPRRKAELRSREQACGPRPSVHAWLRREGDCDVIFPHAFTFRGQAKPWRNGHT